MSPTFAIYYYFFCHSIIYLITRDDWSSLTLLLGQVLLASTRGRNESGSQEGLIQNVVLQGKEKSDEKF